MITSERKQFLEVVIGLAELKGKQLSAPALELYWRALKHWTLEDFSAAAEQLVRTVEWMPTPKHFQDLRKAARPTAGEAWARAREVVRAAWPSQIGETFTCGDELTDRAVRGLGGYRVLALCETDKLTFLERRFAEHYAAMQDATDIREAVPQIAGDGARRLQGPQPVAGLLSPSLTPARPK